MLGRKKINVALDIGSNCIKAVGVSQHKKQRLAFLRMVSVFEDQNVNRPEDINNTIIVQLLRDILHSFKYHIKKVNLSLSNVDAKVGIIEMPILTDDELSAAIQWKLAHNSTEIKSEIQYSYQILAQDKITDTQTLVIGYAPKSILARDLDIISRLHLEPQIVDIDSLAVYNCFMQLHAFNSDQTIALLNIGANKSTIIVVHPQHLPYFLTVGIGGNTLTKQIVKKHHTSFLNAENQKLDLFSKEQQNDHSETTYDWEPFLIDFVGELVQIIKKADIYYRIQYGEERIKQLFLTGGGALLKNLQFQLAKELLIPAQLWNPLSYFDNHKDQGQAYHHQGLFYATALGMALRNDIC